MTFNSITFLFYFFPLVILIYYILPVSVKNIGLILFSLVFYAFGSPKYILLLLLSVVFNYAVCKEMERFKQQEKQAAAQVVLCIGAGFDILILCIFKYTDLDLPIGISFYTFSVLSSLFDVYRNTERSDLDPLHYALYVLLFTKITSGPIVRYNEFVETLSHRKLNLSAFASGLEQFMIGLFKKVLLADNLALMFQDVTKSASMSSGAAILGMLVYSLQLYYDFSGYSDMAIGISRMLGLRFEKNFDYPYLSDGISDFWRRWHISLGRWFREYVYIPLGGNRCTVDRQIFNLAVVWILTGIWHGSTLNFVVWGVYHLTFILLEKFVLKNVLGYIPKPVRILFTAIIACFGWVFFFSASLPEALHYLHQIFGGDHLGFWSGAASYYLRSNLILLLLSLIFLFPQPYRIYKKLVYGKSAALSWVSILCCALLFLLSLMLIVGSTYTSFLYFKF